MSEFNELESIMEADGTSVVRFEVQYTEDFLQTTQSSLPDQNTRLDVITREIECSSADSRDEQGELVAEEDFVFNHEEPSYEEALELIPKAKRLGRKTLVAKLANVLMKNLSVANCVVIFQLASRCDLEELRAASHAMICREFIIVSETCEEFLDLSLEELSLFVFSDDLVATEEHVFNAIESWIKKDHCERQSFVCELLPAVRISMCSLKFLRKTIAHFLVRSEHIFLATAQKRIQLLTYATLSQDRLGSETRAPGRHVLFVMGGNEHLTTVETLHPTGESWVAHHIPEAPRHWTWISSVGSKILVLELVTESFRSFDVLTRSWAELQAPLRECLGSCTSHSGRHVYLLGGAPPYTYRCDRYDVCTDQWEKITPMIEGRIVAAAVCHEGKLYCSGGFARPMVVLASMEVQDLRGDGQWSTLAPMSVTRSCHSLVSCEGFLWAIGGWTFREYLADVERYDVELRHWNTVRRLPQPRQLLSASILKGHIHVIGGYDGGTEYASSVYVYDEESDEWAYGPSLQERRYLHGSCVVWIPSIAAAEQYTVTIQ